MTQVYPSSCFKYDRSASIFISFLLSSASPASNRSRSLVVKGCTSSSLVHRSDSTSYLRQLNIPYGDFVEEATDVLVIRAKVCIGQFAHDD